MPTASGSLNRIQERQIFIGVCSYKNINMFCKRYKQYHKFSTRNKMKLVKLLCTLRSTKIKRPDISYIPLRQ
jgi:hypothetical protein